MVDSLCPVVDCEHCRVPAICCTSGSGASHGDRRGRKHTPMSCTTSFSVSFASMSSRTFMYLPEKTQCELHTSHRLLKLGLQLCKPPIQQNEQEEKKEKQLKPNTS